MAKATAPRLMISQRGAAFLSEIGVPVSLPVSMSKSGRAKKSGKSLFADFVDHPNYCLYQISPPRAHYPAFRADLSTRLGLGTQDLAGALIHRYGFANAPLAQILIRQRMQALRLNVRIS